MSQMPYFHPKLIYIGFYVYECTEKNATKKWFGCCKIAKFNLLLKEIDASVINGGKHFGIFVMSFR